MAGRYATAASQGAPPDGLRRRVESVLGSEIVAWAKPQTGLTPTHRFLITLTDGRRVFVKAATTAQTAVWLRNERLAMATAPARFSPRVIAWIEDEEAPVLVTEALERHWPADHAGVVWRAGDLEQTFAAIRELAAAPADALEPDQSESSARWRDILAAPQSFLDLRLCSADWLEANGVALGDAEAALDTRGDGFVHGDMRSDNICVTPSGVKFVDWSSARRGAPETDLALFLPAAHLEGGPAPFEVMPDGGLWAAQQSALLATRAIEDAAAPEWLRRVFRRLARINLDWAAACLDLPPRDA